MTIKKRGLSFSDIDNNWELILDPENVFWGVVRKNNGNFLLPDELVDLYKKERKYLDKELHDFRFKADLNCIYIDPTDRCNSNCPYCYIPAKIRRDGTEMTAEELDIVLKKIDDYFKNSKKKPVIVFHAAEPLLLKDILFDAIRRYHKRFLFGLQTNALLLEREDVDFLKRFRIGVGISLDAGEADINNRTRVTIKGEGNFQKAVQALRWFNGYEGLNVISTVTKYNVNRLSDLVRFLHSKGVSCVLMNPVRLTQRSAISLKPDEMVFADNLIKAVDTAVELTQKTRRQIVIGNFANIILAIISPTARRMMCDISPCGGGRTFLTVTANGDMIPCGEFIGLKRFSGGNIFKTSISEAMDSQAFKDVRARIVERIDECDTCDFRHICGSPCPAEMYSRGKMYQKAIFCESYKEIIKYAFKLIAEDKVRYLLRKDAMRQLKYQYEFS